ncbi:N-6 DNA methylase [Clostridium sp. CS001]|uniref:Eco57I restriction-modification methylase domain-containing protein n=1 Tax=Clostridium sp. CS001 TaxID=2880648 RepID=UPI001CF33CEF|nr:N-6 DNA methylase [Clostridium sp. CS001]MCB2291593.1 N-6 DNA methylase [Clostridium sp. CS001]
MTKLNQEDYIKEASILLKDRSAEKIKTFFLVYFIAIYNNKIKLDIWDNFKYRDDINQIKNEAICKINKYLFLHWDIKQEDYEFIKWHKNHTKIHPKDDILGKIYLMYSKDINRKKMGEHYTREDIVKHIVYQFKNKRLENKKIIDPCCGSGNFLIEIIKLNFKACRNECERDKLIDKIFSEKYVVGVDVQEIPCIISSIRILLEVLSYKECLNPNYNTPIFQKDSLKDTDEIFNSEYDLVITNPPYLRYQLINEEDRKLFMKAYSSAKGRFDLYTIFIERCIELSKNKGDIIVVTSDKFMTADYGQKIREIIKWDNTLIKVQDLRHIFAFEASVLSAVYYIKKEKIEHQKVVWEKIEENGKRLKVIKKGNVILEDTWRYVDNDVMEVVNKTINQPTVKMLSDLCKISVGIQTTADKVFCEKIKEGKFKSENIEEELLYPLIRGKTINKWRIGKRYKEFNYRDKILYPYIKDDNKSNVINLEDFHNTRKYLTKHKLELEKRNYMGNKKWYEHLSPKNHKILQSIKIITPDLSSRCQFALDIEGFFCNGTVYFIKYLEEKEYDDYLYLLAILNSNLMEFMHKNINTVHLASNKYRFQTNTMKSYPIIFSDKDSDMHQNITRLVKQILEMEENNFAEIEKQINSFIYKLYNLNDKDINIIEDFIMQT